MTPVRIDAFGPRRPWASAGDSIVVRAEISCLGDPMDARLWVALVDLDRECAAAAREVTLTAEPQDVELELLLPDVPRHGYGLRLHVVSAGPMTSAVSAVEVLTGWWESPRHAAITDYHDTGAAAAAVRALAGWHVNVVQHYDWMWRHYRYRPPSDVDAFDDVLGRRVSHAAVRASVAAGHERAIASLAYGSVYGAEPEHVVRHPEDRVFDEAGRPLSLGETFFINDVRPGSAWRARLLGEYVQALHHFGFDGIHMDTYGPPHTAFAGDGDPIDFAELYPGLIEEAASVVGRTVPGARVLFNCVEGFPLESVASAPTVALYLELWPPDDSFADVVRWIDRARGVADGRQVVIAAYAASLKEEVPDAERARAFEPVLLLGSVISAAGAYHHTLAQIDRLLVEGYYPAAVQMTPAEADELQALWRFGARYVHLLSDPGLVSVEPTGVNLVDATGASVPWLPDPVAGSVWVREMVGSAGQRVLHLVDLRVQSDATWTTPKRLTPPTVSLRLRWDDVTSAVAMSPWAAEGDPLVLGPPDSGAALPLFHRWLVVAST